MTKKEAEQRLKEIQDEIIKLQEEITDLQDEESRLLQLIDELTTAEKNRKFLVSPKSISEETSMHVRLYSDTRTTPIMDEFYYSDKEYLIFDNIFYVRTDPSAFWRGISLIVCGRLRYEITTIDDGLTMTDLKKVSASHIYEGVFKDSKRLYSLEREILNATPKLTKARKIIVFGRPICLGGQIFENQTGFGSEYDGPYLVHQGTLYGEITSFYIIGMVG